MLLLIPAYNEEERIEPTLREYAAYFRLVREQMQGTVVLDDGAVAAANYPEPVEHCDICPWSSECSRKRRQDDHLSLVAGISRLQRRELEAHEVPTLTALASTPLIFAWAWVERTKTALRLASLLSSE